MGRTQIYLGDDEIALLEQVERTTGASRSEVIRRAIHTAYAGSSTDERIAALLESAGSWSGRTETGAEIVEAMRSGLDSRLRSLGMD